MSRNLYQIVEDAKEELLDSLLNYGDWPRDPQDKIHEIADSSVPVYTYDVMQLASENWELVLETSDLAGPNDPPYKHITANIYEHISQELGNYLHELEERREEYLDDPDTVWDLLQSDVPENPYCPSEFVLDPEGLRQFIMSDRNATFTRDPLHPEDVPLTDDELWDLLVEAAEERLEEEEEEDD